MKICIVGVSGYGGAETARWVLGHPKLELVGTVSRHHSGKALNMVWPRLPSNMIIQDSPVPADITILALPPGMPAPSVQSPIILDLSETHRNQPGWLYGLPELGVERFTGASRIAGPGCFATALALALLPMREKLPEVLQATGLGGSTGSGASPRLGTHHPLRTENLRPYYKKVFTHSHALEVTQALELRTRLDFIPIAAPIKRGILVSIPISGATLAHYQAFYAGNLLVRVQTEVDVQSVVGTALAALSVVEEGGRAVVFCVIDNLGRGAGSQAVAAINLIAGWPVALGLQAPVPVI
jgi:N-acetyl-gamma-glutamyl-phosphate reductase